MPELIHDDTRLQQFVDSLPAAVPIALDCEFVRERTYWPQLGLIQVQAGDETALIDPLAIADAAALARLLTGPQVKVMHAPGEDFECFLHRYGWLPAPLYDTQLAAAFVGLGSGLSYRAVVEHFTGIRLDKAETRSDWTRRPLSEEQQRYAAEDVLHLETVRRGLDALLDAQGKREWFEEDCRAALDKARRQFANPQPNLDARSFARLDARAAERLRRILIWREGEARGHDRPRGWILDNETCQRLASAPAGDRETQRRILQQGKRVARHADGDLWRWLNADAEPDWPAVPTGGLPNADDKRRLAAAQDIVTRVAERHGLPPGLLFPRRLIEHWLAQPEHWPEAAGRWREALLRDALEDARTVR